MFSLPLFPSSLNESTVWFIFNKHNILSFSVCCWFKYPIFIMTIRRCEFCFLEIRHSFFHLFFLLGCLHLLVWLRPRPPAFCPVLFPSFFPNPLLTISFHLYIFWYTNPKPVTKFPTKLHPFNNRWVSLASAFGSQRIGKGVCFFFIPKCLNFFVVFTLIPVFEIPES